MVSVEPFERCVVCGGITNVLKGTPTKERSCYISSAGQLCFDCYQMLYLLDDPAEEIREKKLTNAVMQMVKDDLRKSSQDEDG